MTRTLISEMVVDNIIMSEQKEFGLSSNQCDCLHYIRDHDFDGRSQKMPCAKCKCQDFGHTLNGVVDETLISSDAPKKVLTETPEYATANKEILKDEPKTEARICGCGAVKPAYSGKLCPKCYAKKRAEKKSAAPS